MRASVNAVSLRTIDRITAEGIAHIAGWTIPTRGEYEAGEEVILFTPGAQFPLDNRLLNWPGIVTLDGGAARRMQCVTPQIGKLEWFPGVWHGMDEDQSERFEAKTIWNVGPEQGGREGRMPNWLFFDRASRDVRDAKNDWADVWEPHEWEAFSLPAEASAAFIGKTKDEYFIGGSEKRTNPKGTRRAVPKWARQAGAEHRLKPGEVVRVHSPVGEGQLIPTGFWRGGEYVPTHQWPAWLRVHLEMRSHMRIPTDWGWDDVNLLANPNGAHILLCRTTPDEDEPEGYELHVTN